MSRIKGLPNRREISSLKAEHFERIQRKQNHTMSEDTANRYKAHEDIKKMIKQGLSKEEILGYLIKTYGNYSFSIYFEQWYEHHYMRINNEKDCEER